MYSVIEKDEDHILLEFYGGTLYVSDKGLFAGTELNDLVIQMKNIKYYKVLEKTHSSQMPFCHKTSFLNLFQIRMPKVDSRYLQEGLKRLKDYWIIDFG